MKPIYKFNNGNGATLCCSCRTIISTGKPVKQLLCLKCQEKALDLLKEADYALVLCTLIDKSNLSGQTSDLIREFIKEVDYE